MRLSRSTGLRRSMTGPRMPLSVISRGPVARRRTRGCKRTPMVRWMFISGPRLRQARSRTGFPRPPMGSLRSSSASTGQRSRCSIRHGNCPTSRSSETIRFSAAAQRQGGRKETKMSIPSVVYLLALALTAASPAWAQKPSSGSVPVTVDNFIRAESDLYFGGILKDSGAIGKFLHRREPARIDNQTVIRLNRDTLYSSAVFDLDAGPVTITLPDAGKRFMSMQVINEDHYVPEVVYGKGNYTLTEDKVGTRYVAVAIRTLVDPVDPKDIEQVHTLQDAIEVNQKAAGTFEAPNWDQASQKKVRDALLVLATTIPDFRKAFGTKAQVDPMRHLIGTAAGWGGNPDKDATYLNITPPQNDGTTIYKLNVKNVPVDAFWSASLYNAEGYYEKNPYDAYSINSITGKKGPDGSIAIQFGGCDGKIQNCLPIMKGWNYTVRLYRPRPEILNGTWKFPEP